MIELQERLKRTCAELGLNAKLGEPVQVEAAYAVPVAHIASIGTPNGLLIFCDANELRPIAKKLVEEGYGYSMLSKPRPTEGFDLEAYKGMFADWGWSGSPDVKPLWMVT